MENPASSCFVATLFTRTLFVVTLEEASNAHNSTAWFHLRSRICCATQLSTTSGSVTMFSTSDSFHQVEMMHAGTGNSRTRDSPVILILSGPHKYILMLCGHTQPRMVKAVIISIERHTNRTYLYLAGVYRARLSVLLIRLPKLAPLFV